MSSKNKKKDPWAKSSLFAGIGNRVKQVASGCREAWCSLQRETRSVILTATVVGVVLLASVIVLGVRLGGVSRDLKEVQAMSLSVQEELRLTKQEMESLALAKEEASAPKKDTLFMMTQPVAEPTVVPTATPEPEKYVVCIDAGHGDWDGGAVLEQNGVEVRIEKDDNLWLAKKLQEALGAYDVEVVMTREADEYLSLSKRAEVANAAGADVLVSLHRNSFPGEGNVKGVEFWVHNSKPEGAVTLAESMLDAIVAVGGMTSRGVKYGSMDNTKQNYEINRKANMTSMIIEFGFVSSISDNAAYDTYGEAYAKAMAKSITDWLEAQNSNAGLVEN